jgi:ankyrin repeat protein
MTAISFSSYFVLGFPGNSFLQNIFLGVFLQETYDECTCKALLKAGANTNAQDNNGQTPGDVAALSSDRFPELARVFCADKPSSIT